MRQLFESVAFIICWFVRLAMLPFVAIAYIAEGICASTNADWIPDICVTSNDPYYGPRRQRLESRPH